MNVAPVAAPRRSSNGLSSQPPRWGRLFWGACSHAFFADKTRRRSGAAIGTSARISGEGDSSALAHPDRGDQALSRRCRCAPKRHPGFHSDTPKQRLPRLAGALISLAYLEEDGALLSIALLAAIVVLAVAAAAVWEMFVGAKWIISLW